MGNKRSSWWRGLLTALVLSAFASQPMSAQTTAETSTLAQQEEQAKQSAAAIALAERERATNELKTARAALETANAEGAEPAPALVAQVDALTRLDLATQQVLAAIEHETELTEAKTAIQSDLDSLRTQGLPEPKPYPFLMLETLRDQLASEIVRGNSTEASIKVAQSNRNAAKSALDEKETQRRAAKEASDTNTNEAKVGELGQTLHLAELASRVAKQQLLLREIELSGHRLEADIQTLRAELLREKVAIVSADVQFSRDELEEILAKLAEREFRLVQSTEWAQADLTHRDEQWIAARARLDSSPARPQPLIEEVEARRLARQARHRDVALLSAQHQTLTNVRTLWNRRYESYNGLLDRATLATHEADARRITTQLERDMRLYGSRLDELRKESRALEAKIDAAKQNDPESVRWLEEQKRQLDALIRSFEETIDRETDAHRLYTQYVSEISARMETVTWRERTKSVWRVIVRIWNYEITSVQDSPITVRKIVIGALLLIIGTIVAKLLSRLFAQKFLPRFGLNEGALAAIQSLLFYLLLLTVAMLSLRMVNVPLTAFTIVGGALAIGIGFGSQNIVNNFISGLILLAERPIRVGDLIEIENLIGTVRHIGPRSTRVRAPANMDIVVPNSSFLEKNVVNWTLSDDRHRAHVTVGVTYGSPTRDVARLIRRAVEEHGKVLQKPDPIILFSEFGDNALIFEVHFWVRMRHMMDRRIIESDVRFRIDSLFREARIVIAFPQRDVHLDSTKPIDIRLLSDGPHSSGDSATDEHQERRTESGVQDARTVCPDKEDE